jgi:dipeptidyl aminopeptidase/acylaminoacyl peptidase
MNSDGTGAAVLTIGDYPSWSPDGTRIAFANNGNLATIRLDGSGLTQLTSTGLDEIPSWSPDGTKLVFDRYVTGTIEDYQVYIINADGSSNGIAKAEEGTTIVFPPHLFMKTYALMRGSTKPLVLKVMAKEAVDIDRMRS